jgi:enterochelin esterase-like enzyme
LLHVPEFESAIMSETRQPVKMEILDFESDLLNRSVRIDIYGPATQATEGPMSLLLVNDGQDLLKMKFAGILEEQATRKGARDCLVAAIHCGVDRMNEYGISSSPDYKGRGAKAALYEQFVVTELIPCIRIRFAEMDFYEINFAGFSMGALSALNIVWNHPEIFTIVGLFSGSFWWRSVDNHAKNYDKWAHRLMHSNIRAGKYQPHFRFFFQCGELDETEDRDKNGVIDSIDDTIDLMRELLKKGYLEGKDFKYLQMVHGRHDVPSWEKAFPAFLKWGWIK